MVLSCFLQSVVDFSVFLCWVYDLYFPYHGLHFSFSKLDLFLEMFSCFNKLFQTEKKKKARRGRSCGLPGVPRVGPHGDGNTAACPVFSMGQRRLCWRPALTLFFLFVCFLKFIYFIWRLITLQYCSGFCHILIWISHGCTCIPHPELPSHLPPIPSLWGAQHQPWAPCLMHRTWTGYLFHIW